MKPLGGKVLFANASSVFLITNIRFLDGQLQAPPPWSTKANLQIRPTKKGGMDLVGTNDEPRSEFIPLVSVCTHDADIGR